MSVIARQRVSVPSYMPILDRAVSATAETLRDVLVGKASPSSSSWTEQRTERGEQAVLEAVWDGRRRGISISQRAIDIASALFWALPEHVPQPEVVVEDDGEIAFDWNQGSEWALTVSVSENGYLGYAGLAGLKSDYGRAPFAGSIPENVLFNLLRVYPLPASRRRGQ